LLFILFFAGMQRLKLGVGIVLSPHQVNCLMKFLQIECFPNPWFLIQSMKLHLECKLPYLIPKDDLSSLCNMCVRKRRCASRQSFAESCSVNLGDNELFTANACPFFLEPCDHLFRAKSLSICHLLSIPRNGLFYLL